MSTANRKSTGRPKGRPNNESPIVNVIPCRCPTCRSSDILIEGGPQISHDIAGQLADGTMYDRIIWRRAKCRSCGQAIRQRAYESSTASQYTSSN